MDPVWMGIGTAVVIGLILGAVRVLMVRGMRAADRALMREGAIGDRVFDAVDGALDRLDDRLTGGAIRELRRGVVLDTDRESATAIVDASVGRSWMRVEGTAMWRLEVLDRHPIEIELAPVAGGQRLAVTRHETDDEGVPMFAPDYVKVLDAVIRRARDRGVDVTAFVDGE